MNILFVVRNAPTPTTGAHTRNLAMLRALGQVSRVTLLIVADDVASETETARALEGQVAAVRVVPAAPFRLKRLYQLAGMLLKQPSIVWRYSSPALGQALRQLLAVEAFDAVYFEGIMVAGHAADVRARVIIDEHNLEWELLQRSAQRAPTRLRRLFNQRESDALRRVELATLGRADLVVVTSERERSILNGLLPNTTVAVAPNGVDVASFTPQGASVEISGRVVFTGAMDYHPNEQAALMFAEQCWPAIRSARPDATWYIVGANPPVSVWRLADLPGVTVTGAVPETRSYLAGAQVTVAPLLVGGGTRLKILEALAMGKTMVSTSIGCEGLDLTKGEHLLVADEPPAFAQAVIDTLNNADLRARLGAAGREAVAGAYGWERSGQALQQAIAALLAVTAPH